MFLRRLISLIFCFLLSLQCATAEFRSFTNASGAQIEAELLELSSDQKVVTIRLKSGRKVPASLASFSPADRKYIKKWWAGVQAEKELLNADSRLAFSAKMNRKSRDKKTYYYADEKVQAYYPELVIDNQEYQSYKGCTVRFVAIAEDRRYKDQRLIVSAKTFKADFPERAKTYLESDPFKLRLYEFGYDDYDYEYGYEYEGYAVIIKNAKGIVTHTRGTKKHYLSDLELLEKCKAGEVYDEKLDHKLNTSPNSYFVR